jgi:hypothetical protein
VAAESVIPTALPSPAAPAFDSLAAHGT